MTAYMTAADVRSAVVALGARASITDAQLDSYIAEFTQIAESYRGVSYMLREVTDVFDLADWPSAPTVALTNPSVTEVTVATIGGVAVDVAGLEVDGPAGLVTNPGGWHGVVAVTYSSGSDLTALLLRACREYVRSVALTDASSVPRDVISQAVEGSYTRYSTADWSAGRPTGYLEVDRLLNSLPDRRIPGIA